MYAFQNGFHHEKVHILILNLGISALGHQIHFAEFELCLVRMFWTVDPL